MITQENRSPATGIGRDRAWRHRSTHRVAERLHRQAKRYGRPYAVAMIDSDNLKACAFR